MTDAPANGTVPARDRGPMVCLQGKLKWHNLQDGLAGLLFFVVIPYISFKAEQGRLRHGEQISEEI